MDLDLGPLSVLYSWQFLLLAVVVAGLTHVLKAALDLQLGGTDKREQLLWAQRVVLPLTPIILGAFAGALVPLHPEAFTAYLATQAASGSKYYVACAFYGAAVGVLSDYLWHRLSGVMDSLNARAGATANSVIATPPLDPPEPKP